MLGYNPKLILAGRNINDKMGKIIVDKVLLKIKEKKITNNKIRVLILGLTFKENCTDTRNSKVFDIIKEFNKKNFLVHVYDPLVQKKFLINKKTKFFLRKNLKKNYYNIIILAVAHNFFLKLGIKKIKELAKMKHIFFDVKNCFDSKHSDLRL
jgi:UDP-N-acetyl-D-galactosamine dehydrogenase